MNLSGKWKGVIVYGPEYEEDENQELYFTVDITQDLEQFTGIAKDTSGLGCNPDSATIKGFVDNNTISFVKQYASTLTFDENGNEVVEKGKPSPIVNYWGEYDTTLHKFVGGWEICVDAQQFGEGWFEEVFTGTWSMQRF